MPLNKYKYALYQDEEGSIPTLILESLDNDRTGYLLFRYNVATGTTEQIGSDSSTRFEPASDAINSIPWDSWYDITDSSGLDAWEP